MEAKGVSVCLYYAETRKTNCLCCKNLDVLEEQKFEV